jgi:hypothetical protein
VVVADQGDEFTLCFFWLSEIDFGFNAEQVQSQAHFLSYPALEYGKRRIWNPEPKSATRCEFCRFIKKIKDCIL